MFRLYQKPSDNKESIERVNVTKLYESIAGDCGKNGFDVVRTGGSSGPPLADEDFFDCHIDEVNFPRKLRAVKFAKDGTSWSCAYIKVREDNEGEPAFHSYGPPRRGGQFVATQVLMKRFPFLYSFAESKVYAAFILDRINSLQKIPIQPTAVANEISLYERGLFISPGMRWSSLSKQGRENEVRARRGALVLYAINNKHTLVTHPVGFHQDKFADGKESLENKVCFKLDGWHKCRMGRGGAGPNVFVFAVLDWVNSSRGEEKRTQVACGYVKVPLNRKSRKAWHLRQPQLKHVKFHKVQPKRTYKTKTKPKRR